MPMEKVEISEAAPASMTNRRWGKTWPQHLAACLAGLSLFVAGSVDAWTAPGIPHLEQPRHLPDNVTVPGITYDQGSWIGSLSPLGSLFGALPAGYLADSLGRRFLMLYMAIPMLLCWLLILIIQNSVPLLYIARFVLGFTCGVVSVAQPLYSDEIAEVRVRGALGTYLAIMFTGGMLYVYFFGAILSYKGMTIACTLLPVLFGVTFYWMPESPLYLLTKGQAHKAKKSLRWLRGVGTGESAEIEGELNEMQSFINRSTDSTSVSTDKPSLSSRVVNYFRSITVTPETLKAIYIIFGMMAFRQLCGLNAILAYTVEVFESAGSAWNPYANAAIFGAIQFVITVIAIFIVDRLGRRVLLIISGSGVVLSLLLLVIHFHLLDEGIELTNISWLPVIAVNLYIATFSIGLGPIPWFMMPELLSNEARGWVSSLAVCFNWTTAFLVTRFFLVMLNVWGPLATYGIFLGVSYFGTIFIVFFVPETKMRTREEIHNQLSNHWLFVTGWHQ